MNGKDKIEILRQLYKDGFVHEESYQKKLDVLVSELKNEDRIKIKEKESILEKENEDKGYQIDYFTYLIKDKIDIANTLKKEVFIRSLA